MQQVRICLTDLISLVGGRAAEEVVFGSVTNGAYDDIKKATNLAKTMITRYGMSDRFGLSLKMLLFLWEVKHITK